MDREAELAVIRRAYAKQILSVFAVNNSSVEAAFGAVHREDFLGAGPWSISRHWGTMAPTPNDDPVYLYTDNVVAIDPTREINNGQPSLHAHLLAMAAPRKGEHIVHIGTGTGYYTAIMAEMVGPSGRVTGIEFDPELAIRTKQNLSAYPSVRIVCGDGAKVDFDAADVIYVNAGATAPAKVWLERLNEGGRLILPLTTDKGFGKIDFDREKIARQGAVFCIRRTGDEYRAKWISAVAIFPCAGIATHCLSGPWRQPSNTVTSCAYAASIATQRFRTRNVGCAEKIGASRSTDSAMFSFPACGEEKSYSQSRIVRIGVALLSGVRTWHCPSRNPGDA